MPNFTFCQRRFHDKSKKHVMNRYIISYGSTFPPHSNWTVSKESSEHTSIMKVLSASSPEVPTINIIPQQKQTISIFVKKMLSVLREKKRSVLFINMI